MTISYTTNTTDLSGRSGQICADNKEAEYVVMRSGNVRATECAWIVPGTEDDQ